MNQNTNFVWFHGAIQLIIYGLMGSALLSCGTIPNKPTPHSSNYRIDTLNIEIDDRFLGSYSENDIVFLSSNEAHLFFGLNAKKHQIDVIDLLNKQQLDPIRLDNQGPNGIIGFENFVYYKNKFVFWKPTSGELIFIDWQGRIIDKYDLENRLTEIDNKLTFLNSGGLLRRKGLHRMMQVVGNTFILPTYCKCKKNEQNYYENPFFAKFNLEQNIFQVENAHYPDELVDGKFHGDHDQFSVLEWENELYVNFGFSPNIFHVSSDKLSEIIIRSQKKYDLTETITWSNYNAPQSYIKHFDSYQFGAVMVDHYRKCLIRPLKHAEFTETNYIRPTTTKMTLSIIDPILWSEKDMLEFDFYNTFSINEKGLTIPVGLKIVIDKIFYSFIQVEL